MKKAAETMCPAVVLFENVTGLTDTCKDEKGNQMQPQIEAWRQYCTEGVFHFECSTVQYTKKYSTVQRNTIYIYIERAYPTVVFRGLARWLTIFYLHTKRPSHNAVHTHTNLAGSDL